MNEHDYEPVPGLPARLPEGESILWQGAPQWKTLARRGMRVWWVAAYFAVLVVWGMTGRLATGNSIAEAAVSALWLGALGSVALGLLVLFSWLVARTTIYTITTRRLIMRFGIALPITIQITFQVVDSAAARIWSNGCGDILLTLLPSKRVAYLVLWPHARPWKLAKAQPALRGVANAAAVAQTLGRALAASASQPPTATAFAYSNQIGDGAPVPATA